MTSPGWLLCLAFAASLLLVGAQQQYIVNCNYERDNCTALKKLGNDDRDLTFTVASQGTPSEGTGPNSGANNTIRFIFLETSGVVSGRAARLTTGALGFQGSICVSFYYHMYGEDIDELSVYLQRSGATNNDVFREKGPKTRDWIYFSKDANVDNSNRELVFEARSGDGYRGDIAIDEIKVWRGTCSGSVTPPPVGTTRGPDIVEGGEILWNCDFSNGVCGIAQASNDNLDWTRRKDGTPSGATGPSNGYGGGTDNYFFYMEATGTGLVQGNQARFHTPNVRSKGSMACVRIKFYYHMYGDSMGSLSVTALSNDMQNNFFFISGDQGDRWHKAEDDVDYAGGDIQFVFTAVRGDNFRSDIAVDAITITDCSLVSAPSTVVGTPSTAAPTSAPTAMPTTEAVPGASNVNVQPSNVFISNDVPGSAACRVINTAKLPFYWNGIKWRDPSGKQISGFMNHMIVETQYSPPMGSHGDFWISTINVDSVDHTLSGKYTCEVDYNSQVSQTKTNINVKGCATGEFTCADKAACIPCSMLCDTYNDCGDNSDEFRCGTDRAPNLMDPNCA